MTLADIVERDRVCLVHGKVLTVTEKLELSCPVGPHKVTRWGVGDPRAMKVRQAFDADTEHATTVATAAAAARKETEMPRGVAGSGPQSPRAAKEKTVKLAGSKFTAGDERLALKLVRNNAWAQPYRVLIATVAGKLKEKGVVGHGGDETEGREAYQRAVAKATGQGWIEAGIGTLTDVPAPKGVARPKLRAAK